MAVRLQPNHPTDDPRGIAASIVDGLMLGCGDAVIGINPATDNVGAILDLLTMLDDIIAPLRDPDAVLRARPTSRPRIEAIERGAPVDLVFQSIAGTEGGQRLLRHRRWRCCGSARGGAVASSAAPSATT